MEFVTNPKPEQWKQVLDLYDDVLKLKADKKKPAAGKELLQLDKWYQNELPDIIGARKEKYVTKVELEKLLKWKLARGKFRPMLPGMVASNSEESIEKASKAAFKAIPDSLSKAIKELSVLRGIGPATASAVLAAGCPDNVPFMADESVLALPQIAVLKYDLNCYLDFSSHVSDLCESLQEDDADGRWNVHKVELALWTYVMGKQLKPEAITNVLGDGSSKKRSKENSDREERLAKRKK